jgi:hypothetical protein
VTELATTFGNPGVEQWKQIKSLVGYFKNNGVNIPQLSEWGVDNKYATDKEDRWEDVVNRSELYTLEMLGDMSECLSQADSVPNTLDAALIDWFVRSLLVGLSLELV